MAGIFGGVALAFVLTSRLMMGYDWLTGDDPVTVRAAAGHPELDFTFLAYSQGVYRVKDSRAGTSAFLTLNWHSVLESDKSERLTGPVQFHDCEKVIPTWMPRFSPAKGIACISVTTDQSARTFASYQTTGEELLKAIALYNTALDELIGGRTGGFHAPPQVSQNKQTGLYTREDGADLSGTVSWSSPEGGRSVAITYYSDQPFYPGVVVSFAAASPHFSPELSEEGPRVR
ncbi:MAG: hypothetical protein ABI972_08595 [Acidobacteriota bacterium]